MTDELNVPIDTRLQREAIEVAITRAEEAREKENDNALAARVAKKTGDADQRRSNHAKELRAMIRADAIGDMIAMLHGVHMDLLKAEQQASASLRRAMGAS